jgi:hypothetical protein
VRDLDDRLWQGHARLAQAGSFVPARRTRVAAAAEAQAQPILGGRRLALDDPNSVEHAAREHTRRAGRGHLGLGLRRAAALAENVHPLHP